MSERKLVKGGRVSKSEAWKYALGIFGQNLSCALMMNWFFIYCTDVLYIEGKVIGIVLGIARIWDGVNDPLMGTLIDRHTFKNGDKFRPFLRMTPIAIGIIVIMLFAKFIQCEYLINYCIIQSRYSLNIKIFNPQLNKKRK